VDVVLAGPPALLICWLDYLLRSNGPGFMPKYAEYVFTAYGLFVIVVGFYAVMLIRRTRAARRTLEALTRASKPSA